MVADYQEKIKEWCRANKKDLYTASVIFFVGLSGFGLGRLSAVWPEKEPITIENQEASIMNQAFRQSSTGYQSEILNTEYRILDTRGKYVASKSGSAYHYPWCTGAQKIKEENKIWFQTKDEAESRGYKPAGNCEGL